MASKTTTVFLVIDELFEYKCYYKIPNTGGNGCAHVYTYKPVQLVPAMFDTITTHILTSTAESSSSPENNKKPLSVVYPKNEHLFSNWFKCLKNNTAKITESTTEQRVYLLCSFAKLKFVYDFDIYKLEHFGFGASGSIVHLARHCNAHPTFGKLILSCVIIELTVLLRMLAKLERMPTIRDCNDNNMDCLVVHSFASCKVLAQIALGITHNIRKLAADDKMMTRLSQFFVQILEERFCPSLDALESYHNYFKLAVQMIKLNYKSCAQRQFSDFVVPGVFDLILADHRVLNNMCTNCTNKNSTGYVDSVYYDSSFVRHMYQLIGLSNLYKENSCFMNILAMFSHEPMQTMCFSRVYTYKM
ncbi:unknown [Helicoverpa armigera nucleopolyhedrovirus]|uniref:Uncharacterized protein n=2 Tax=Helicoverpa armigera nucleopolyhedrovirus TaxID=51313 RepID=Q99H13_9ABAC|nr:hypothetical protein HanGV4gp034 [Helicoverpa armigera nucleopolyhedrovirus G4]AAG53777.1 unknown [Helicoverpa armigera nucleopolyhedrovirus G4]AAK64312.1 unknown [Helicoverpa armigera nucleopolyhedrovirus]AXR98023.1 hypothetical protein [Helicoverpa assulta nucleopolyhedrovirus]UCC42504.1 hypothetical protein [Helicoverpa armigera nucleopolyhedrovirus]